MRSRQSQRGIALITAIILVAIATVVATAIGFAAAMSARRASTVFGADQSLLAAEGAEAMAAYALKESTINSTQVSPAQDWAQNYGPYQLMPGVTLESAQIEDMQGRFNINNLAPGGVVDNTAVDEFKALLVELNLEEKWAYLLADWIDANNEPLFPDGAEDSTYLAQTPPSRAANIPITSISELMALPGFGRDRYNALEPYIAALPPGTAVNVCTASGVVLDAVGGTSTYHGDASVLADSRKTAACFPTVATFEASVSTGQKDTIGNRVTETSSYFRLRSVITIGTAHFTLYSLLYSNGGQIRPLLRTFGTE